VFLKLPKIPTKKTTKKTAGIILITTMLFMVILSLLAITILQANALETKISVYERNIITAKYLAENYLIAYEQKILNNKLPDEHIELIDSKDVCGVTFYFVNAKGESGNAKIALQSTFAKVEENNNCKIKPAISSGRISWKEV
jgi:hypothetical protein